MHDQLKIQTDIEGGFNLPAAYRAHDKRLNHLVAVASLFASAGVAVILGLQIVGLA